MKKTLSQIRSEAGKKGAASRKYTADKDPLRTVNIRTSTKKLLEIRASRSKRTMTDELDELIKTANQVDQKTV